MSTYTLEAVVLQAAPLGERDRLITSYTRQRGLHRAVARGARRLRSSLGPCLQPYAWVDLLCWRGRSLDGISQCGMRQGFRRLHDSLPGMAAAAFLAELTSLVSREDDADPAVFELLVAALTELTALVSSRGDAGAAGAGMGGGAGPGGAGELPVHWPDVGPVELLLLSFQWKLFARKGFRPTLDCCAVCGRPPRGGTLPRQVYFSLADGGLICQPCRQSRSTRGVGGRVWLPVETAAVRTVNALVQAPLTAASQLPVPMGGSTAADLTKLSSAFGQWILDRPLRSLAFLEQLAMGPPTPPKPTPDTGPSRE